MAVGPREGGEEVERRTVIGSLSLAVFGTPLLRLGERLEQLGLPSDAPLPSRLTMSQVHTVEAATDWLRAMARQVGGMADEFGDAVRRYSQWLAVPGDDVVKARFGCALSELCTEAGWCGYDSGVGAMGYFTRGVTLAATAGDGFGVVNAAWHAGATMLHSGHPDDALKCFQIGQYHLGDPWPGKSTPAVVRSDDPRVPMVTGRLAISSAAAYARVDAPERARGYLARSRETWQPRDVFERADKDLNTALVLTNLGNLDTAVPFAQSAVRTFGDAHARGRAIANTTLALVHVRAGEPRGLTLAAQAIDGVSALHSVAARQRLVPLADVLETRPGSDAHDLARKARHVAAAQV